MANIIKFEVGAEYWDTSAVDHNDVMIIKITRRTEKSVWFVRMHGGKEDGEPSRTKVFANNSYEYIMPYRYSMAPVWGADHKAEDAAETTAPEADAVTPDEPEAAQEQTEEAKARELHARARELRERAEGLCEEGKLLENFARSVRKVELQAYKAAAHESAMRLASKNPRVAAAMERLRAEQTANDEPEAETASVADPDEVYDRMETLRGMGGFLNKFLDAGNHEFAHGMKLDIDWALSVDEKYGIALEVEYDADGRFADVRERKPETADDGAEAGRPAPQEDAASEGAESVEAEAAPAVRATRNPVAPYDLFRFHAESGTYLFENEGEAALIDALEFHADAENALSVVRALYEITHDGGGWVSPRNHPVMLDALNAYIEFLTEEIEVFDNFPNAAEKEIAVGKLAEAKVIRDAFAADVARAAAETTQEAATEIIKAEPIGNGRVLRLVRDGAGYGIETAEPSGNGAFQVGWAMTLRRGLEKFAAHKAAYA